jgi:hypothetical protein
MDPSRPFILAPRPRLALGLVALGGLLLLALVGHGHADGHEDHCALCLAAASVLLGVLPVALTAPVAVAALSTVPVCRLPDRLAGDTCARAPPATQ